MWSLPHHPKWSNVHQNVKSQHWPPPVAPRPPKRTSGSPPSAQRGAGKKPRAERKQYAAFDGLEERRKFPVGNSELGHAPMRRRCADDAPGGDEARSKVANPIADPLVASMRSQILSTLLYRVK